MFTKNTYLSTVESRQLELSFRDIICIIRDTQLEFNLITWPHWNKKNIRVVKLLGLLWLYLAFSKEYITFKIFLIFFIYLYTFEINVFFLFSNDDKMYVSVKNIVNLN